MENNEEQIIKEKFKKKLKRKLIKIALQCMIPIIIALCFFAVLNTIKDTLIDLLSNAGTAISGFLSEAWQWMTDDYWIKLDEKVEYIVDANTGETLGTPTTITDADLTDENGNPKSTTTESYTIVDKYVKELGNQGLSLQALRLLGDADYSNEEKLLEDGDNKELVEKYIAEFIRADIITQQPHKRRGKELVSTNSQNWIDGGIYLYRTKKEPTINEDDFIDGNYEEKNLEVTDKDYEQMDFLQYESTENKKGFMQRLEENDPELRYKYTIDPSTGDLIFAKIITTTVANVWVPTDMGWFNEIAASINEASAKETTYKLEEVRIPYKEYISKYTMPYEFLINLCEITQNPEFVYHVALLARDTDIKLVVQDNVTKTIETVENYKEETKYYNLKSSSIEGATTSIKKTKIRKITTTTVQTPVLRAEYADTWSFYEEFEFTKNVEGTLTDSEPTVVENNPSGNILNHIEKHTYISYEASDGAYEGVGIEVTVPEHYEGTFTTKEETRTQVITTTTTYNEAITKGEPVEKSKQFLGLLRNDTGKCDYDCSNDAVSLRYNPIALKCAEKAEFNKNGINVQYRIPNMTRTESPLNKLTSGIEMLYSVLESNSSSGNEYYESVYVEKMQGLVEHLRYLMTFPDEPTYTKINDEDGEDDEEYVEVEVDDIIVKTDEPSAASEVTREELITIINASSYSQSKKNNAISLVDVLMNGQNLYKVNPIFMLAVANQETSIGLADSTYVKQHNNWTSYNLGVQYSSPQNNMEVTINAIANGSYYFKQGKYTIKDIGYTYCPNTESYPTQGDNWVVQVTNTVKYLYSLMGAEVGDGTGYDYIYTSSSGKSYKVYRQSNYPNIKYGSGTIANKGCGLTSDATVLSAYGCNKDPEKLLNGRNIISIDGELRANGVLATRIKGQDAYNIRKVLKSGKPVIIHVNSSSSYTKNEHWMPLLDIREKNGEAEVYVANPNKYGKDGWDKLSNVLIGCIEYIIINE